MVGHTVEQARSGKRHWLRNEVSVWYSKRREVRVIVDEMRRNQDTTLHWIDQFKVAINHTYEEIQINRDHINILIKEVESIFTELNNSLSGVQRQTQMVHQILINAVASSGKNAKHI